MSHHDETSAVCLIFTYKEGLLSRVAHDLRIRVTRLEIDIDDETLAVCARFDARSLRVECALREGVAAPGLLSDGDRRKIEDTIRSEVLFASRHPHVLFRSTEVARAGEDHEIRGALTLLGVSREIRFTSRREEGAHQADVTLHQPDFGMKPYTAMLGTLRIKPDVLVRVRVPLAR